MEILVVLFENVLGVLKSVRGHMSHSVCAQSIGFVIFSVLGYIVICVQIRPRYSCSVYSLDLVNELEMF